jgi:methionyl-tRNA formyltransferase
MKFVFFGYDFSLPVVQRLIHEGHECLGIFSFPCDNQFNFNTRTRAFGVQQQIPVSLEKPKPAHLDVFLAKGCEAFIAAGYLYKIPPVDESKAYALNLHPSLLPKGRGIMPMPYILLHHPEAAGITVHKMTDEFDKGDILYQEKINLTPTDDVETLTARVAMQAPGIIAAIVAGLPLIWRNAREQDESQALHWPPPTDAMRVIDWNSSIDDIQKLSRAFGRFGVLARIDNLLWAVYSLSAWKQEHDLKPGSIALRQNREIIVAAGDGFVCLKEMQEMR